MEIEVIICAICAALILYYLFSTHAQIDSIERKLKKLEKEKDIEYLKKLESGYKPKKSADEMFEELGYYIDKEDTYYGTLVYTKDYLQEEYIVQIVFDKVTISFGKRLKKDNIPVLITKEEHEAINKKLEELEIEDYSGKLKNEKKRNGVNK